MSTEKWRRRRPESVPDASRPTPAPVAVVIPAFNAQETIGAAVASVLQQTSVPAQIIVVDDGSTDGTVDDLLARFGGVLEIVRQRQGGPSRARNAGLDRVAEPWVAFLDADDVWHPEKLARQLAVAVRMPDVGVVACDWVRTAAAWPPALHGPPRAIRVRDGDILFLNRFQTSTVLARTELVRTLGGFDSALDGVEDWDLWLRLAAAAPCVRLPEALVVYRDRPSGYSKNLRRVYRTMRRLVKRAMRARGLSPREQARVAAWHELRFMVAFWRVGDRRGRDLAWRRAFQQRPMAVATGGLRLIPFLAGRAMRRWSAAGVRRRRLQVRGGGR